MLWVATIVLSFNTKFPEPLSSLTLFEPTPTVNSKLPGVVIVTEAEFAITLAIVERFNVPAVIVVSPA